MDIRYIGCSGDLFMIAPPLSTYQRGLPGNYTQKTNSIKMEAHKYKIAFTKKCIFRVMGLKMNDWVVFCLIYYTYDALRTHVIPPKGLPLSIPGLLTLILQMQKSWENLSPGSNKIIFGFLQISILAKHFLEHFICAAYLVLSTWLQYKTSGRLRWTISVQPGGVFLGRRSTSRQSSTITR